MKSAHLEMIGGVIRVFAEGKQYGDEYEYAITFRTLAHDKAEMIGVIQPPTISQWKAIQKCLKENGIKTFVLTRKRSDGTIEVRERST